LGDTLNELAKALDGIEDFKHPKDVALKLSEELAKGRNTIGVLAQRMPVECASDGGCLCVLEHRGSGFLVGQQFTSVLAKLIPDGNIHSREQQNSTALRLSFERSAGAFLRQYGMWRPRSSFGQNISNVESPSPAVWHEAICSVEGM